MAHVQVGLGACQRDIDQVGLFREDADRAATVIMINTADAFPSFEGEIAGVTIPFLGVKSSATSALEGANSTTITVSDEGVIPNPGFRALASFTSGGPRSGDSGVKPDVAALGMSINSTGVGTGTGGSRILGTSMAAPHTAGVAALAIDAHPGWGVPRS